MTCVPECRVKDESTAREKSSMFIYTNIFKDISISVLTMIKNVMFPIGAFSFFLYVLIHDM